MPPLSLLLFVIYSILNSHFSSRSAKERTLKLKMIKFLPCFFFLFGTYLEPSIGAVKGRMEILSTGERSITIALQFSAWSFEKTQINGQELTRLDFDGAYFSDGPPGEPQIPHHVVVLGIPVGARIRYSIVDSDFEALSEIKIVPNPRLKKAEGWPEWEYVLDESIYQSPRSFPEALVKIAEPAFFRDQQIAQIQVAGVKYLPAKSQILKYNRIVLRLEFVGGQNNARSEMLRPQKLEEELYRNVILNSEQASKWRKINKGSRAVSKKVFGNGTLYKLNIRQEGLYKIDGAFLDDTISNLDLSQIDPTKIRLFSNGGRELSRVLNEQRPDGLIENAIIVEDGGDGRFDRADFILFYGIGVEGWSYDTHDKKFSHYINHYGFDNVYWLSFDGQQNGKRIPQVNSSQPTGSAVEIYQGLAFVEEETVNPLLSGLNWFGRQFAIDEVSRTQTFNFNLPNAITDSSATLNMRFVSKNSGRHQFAISMNGSSIGTHQFFGARGFLGQYLIMQSSVFSTKASNVLSAGTNSLQISYSHSSSNGQALLDWIELIYAAKLQAVDNEIGFIVFPESGLQTYRISNFSNNAVRLFDVTDFSNVREIVGFDATNGTITFAESQQPNSPKRYLALDPSKYRSISNVERVEFTDLRNAALGAEFIIITHEDFYSEAIRLESLRENGNPDNRLQTEVVRISDIFNSFSGGLVDPTAIRDFIKFAYENWTPRPVYVLLLGDGDFDYKDRNSQDWIPTFQTDELAEDEQLAELVTRTTDSWYTYVSGDDQIMDLAIGRINAQSLSDAKRAVDKIIAYETHPLRGSWRNTITMVGDDELVTGGRASPQDDVHIRQTESIAETAFPDCFDVEKIYLTEFPKVLSASVGGVVKPAAREALIQQINKGTLIVNYIGHGNSTVWAHEAIFRQSDNDRVQNLDKLIFFVAATCDWALFDRPDRQSQAEELLLTENRGAIAILSSARLVFSSSNFVFNRKYYENLFSANGPTSRLGDAFVATRIKTGTNRGIIINDEKYHIYGDPTLRLAVPQEEAVITDMTPDSIVALTTVQIMGEVRKSGQLQADFNGTVFLNTFDSKRFVRNIPEAGSAQEYFLPGNSIYRGTVPVQNGVFTARFIVPKDISYGGNLARVSAYFWNDQTDGAGCKDNIKVSSTSSDLADDTGPEIQIYFRGHETFTTGDIIEENVTLIVDIADTLSGVNIAGEIGHRLILSVDPNEETCLAELNRFNGISEIELTDLFQFKEGDHLRGTVEFPLNFPKEVNIAGQTVSCVAPDGEDRHTLVVKAWDNANNSSTAAVEVLVVHEEGLVLSEIMNYPNPFTQNTTFTFISNQDAEVTIKIYTISGQLIQTLEYPLAASGFNMVQWDGRDAEGDFPANGVYLYKLIARSEEQSGVVQKEFVGRLAILR